MAIETERGVNRRMATLLIVVATLLGLLLAGVIAGAGSETAVAHPLHAPMQRGIDAGTLGAPVWSGYAVGLLLIAAMWPTMLIGFRPHPWIRKAVSVWTIAYMLIYVALMQTFGAYAAGRTAFFGGFTVPAAWLVYGMMLFPWVILLVMTFTFESAYFGPDEQARFDEIVAEAKTPRTSSTRGD